MSRLTWDGSAEFVSRDQILRARTGTFSCSVDHKQDWHPYPVDPYSAVWDGYTYIHTKTYSINSILVPWYQTLSFCAKPNLLQNVLSVLYKQDVEPTSYYNVESGATQPVALKTLTIVYDQAEKYVVRLMFSRPLLLCSLW